MKTLKIFIIIIATLFANDYKSDAKCSDFKFVVYPSGNTITTNPIFILECSKKYLSIINEKYGKHKIYLTSNKGIVDIMVIDSCDGQNNNKQILLKPKVTLQAGIYYSLIVENMEEFIPSKRRNYEFYLSLKHCTIASYLAINTIDSIPPKILNPIKVKAKVFRKIGSEGDNYVDFDMIYSDSSKIVVKTILKNKLTGIIRNYYLLPVNNILRVGREMCGGPFNYSDGGDEYEVSFVLIDLSGNILDLTSQPISFTKPN